MNASTWDVVVYGTHYQSTSNHFGYSGTANSIIGEELVGTSGASSPRVDFTNNAWLGTTSSNWQYQQVNVNVAVYNPPYGKWEIYPSNSSAGGDLCVATTSAC